MTNDEIRKLAEEAGWDHNNHDAWWTYVIPKFRRLIELVQAMEMNHEYDQ
uniref:Uncharacterized protein n=1 Tax=viral metagenome TaxID=1070528 RepID=A0A6M3LBM6_9ZZZZ